LSIATFSGTMSSAMSDPVAAKLAQLVAPGAEVIITAGEPASLLGTALGDRLLVPLRAIAHIRMTCPGLLGPSVVRISTWHQGEGHAKEEDLTRADHFSAAAD